MHREPRYDFQFKTISDPVNKASAMARSTPFGSHLNAIDTDLNARLTNRFRHVG